MEDAAQKNGQSAELECVRKACAGDRDAFEILMNKYRKEIYRLAYRMVGNHHDADDVAQETFVKAFLSMKKFRGSSSFKTWIYSIAINSARDVSARQGRARRVELPLMEGASEVMKDSRAGEYDVSAQELIASTVNHLPERQREVLVLKVFHGMKHSEIARALGITTGAAKANLFHAIKCLKSKLHQP